MVVVGCRRTDVDILWAAHDRHADAITVKQSAAPLPAIIAQHRLSVQGRAFFHVSFSENNLLEVEFPHLMRADELLYHIAASHHANRRFYSRQVTTHHIQTYPRCVNLSTTKAHQASDAVVVVSGSNQVHGPPVHRWAMCWYALALCCPDGVGVPGQMPLQGIATITPLALRKEQSEDGAVLRR